ncbi:MAG: protein translocase SEC61 complex subunit gamma [Nanoarchaeota archaeon]|nr:protein translocase SEC61 complex subunit gamma [Nanoarchaeota archaeon]
MNLKQIRREAAKYINPKYALGKLKSLYYQYKRVLKRTKKPSREEFIDIVKISAAGMIAIGMIGFVIQTIFLYIIKI